MNLPDKEKMTILLGYFVIALSFIYIALVSFIKMTPAGQEISKIFVGFLMGSGLATIINYIWGSSAGSAAKSKAIEKKLKIPEDDCNE